MSGLTQRYISKELVHFIGRGKQVDEQFGIFIKIIKEGWLTHPPHQWNISGNMVVKLGSKISNNEMYAPQVVCFADIPVQDLSIHIRKYSSFGISFTKDFLVKAGASPVRYIPNSASVRISKNLSPEQFRQVLEKMDPDKIISELFDFIPISEYFDHVLKEYPDVFTKIGHIIYESDEELFKRFSDIQKFIDFYILGFLKFFDPRLGEDHPDNYYFEREWRVLGNIRFSMSDIKTIFLPERFSKPFRVAMPDYHGQVIFID